MRDISKLTKCRAIVKHSSWQKGVPTIFDRFVFNESIFKRLRLISR